MELLKVEKLNVLIGNEKKIENGSFEIRSGDVVLMTGPNGCGKSTIIKLIMGDIFEYSHLNYSGSIFYKEEHDIGHSESENEYFRKHVCYVSQEDEFESDNVMDCFLLAINYHIKENREKYIFEFVTKYDIQDCFGFDENTLQFDGKARRLAVKLKLTELSVKEKKAIKFLSMSIRKMSGGQKKLTNIFTNLIRYEFSDLLLMDEPLNNLDYNNVRSFSNVLTQIYRSKPELGIVLVTHCRSIPIVNRIIEIDAGQKSMIEIENYSCSSCFGKVDEHGYYT